MRFWKALSTCLAGVIVYTPTDAQQSANTEIRPALTVLQVEAGPVLDGRVMDDPVWQGVPVSTGFIQTTPDEGEPASQRTEIRVTHTGTKLFIGIIAFDTDVDAIVVSDSRRDASLNETDALQIIFDTFRDGQNGFVFGTNPSGLQYDGQVTREGEGGFGSGNSGGGFNINWDGVWDVKTHVGENSWSAEFAIPFTTLRYPAEEVQSWGFNVQRNIRRRNETAYWSPLERQFNLFRVSNAGRLDGLQVPSQKNFQFVPYLLTEFSDIGAQGKETDGEAGFDIKYSITPSMTLDLTYNTDFAQVEVDEVQVNLDRFNLFFPEKRPFFLENAGQFSVGDGGDIELFFSRRIGISEDGEVIPIVGGARVSGKVNRTNVGFLYMQTEELGNTEAADDFLVARVNQELDNRSSIGAMFVNREGTGSLAGPDDKNSTFGVDGRWGLGEYIQFSGFAAKTDTPGLNGDDYAYSVKGELDSEHWSGNLSYTQVREDFNPEVGFLRREAYKNPGGFILYRHRPENNPFGLHEIRPHVSYNAFYTFDDFKESARVHADTHWEFVSSAEIHTGINFVHEGLLEPFEISEGIFIPPGSYNNREAQLVGQTNRGAPLSLRMTARIGGFFSGDRVQIASTVRWRHGERFTSELNWTRNDVDLPTGNFVTDLGRVRLSYTMSQRSTLQALFQYNNVDEVWSTNLRYSWLRSANTGLFVVYNDSRGFGGFDGEEPNRSILIKYSHLFNLL